MIEANADDARLLDAVHPPAWTNPTAKDRYHLVVIGAGTAGLVSAAGAAGLGAKVALIERHLMGGDCLNVGCVPSKGIIAAARAWHEARRSRTEFHGPDIAGDGDFAGVMQRMRRLRADLSPVDSAARFRELGVDVFLGEARFAGRDRIVVGGQTLRFRRAVIATGGRAAAPPIPGLEHVSYLTNETLFDITTLPAHLVILGGGPIGCEMAQTFRRLGSDVTLIDRAAHILPKDDADAAAIVQRALEREGVAIMNGASVERVEQDGERIVVTAHTASGNVQVIGNQLLVATGRTPNIESLGLDVAGVQHTKAGVTVDDRLRTSNHDVFACGDCCSSLKFTHLADFQARMVIQNALFFGRKKASNLIVPWATYTSPELAQVGHTAASAREAGVDIETFEVPFHDVDRAVLDGEVDGFVRVHLERGSDTIVGATIVGDHAADQLAEVVLAMTSGLGLGAIGAAIHSYPTQGDAVRKCADAWRKTKLTPRVKTLFGWWFRLFS